MKKLLAVLLLGALVVPTMFTLGGCLDTMVMDWPDRQQTIARNADLERKQLNEDWDYLWLQDEVSQLSPWYLPDPE